MKKCLAALLVALLLIVMVALPVSASPSGVRVPPPGGGAFPVPTGITVMVGALGM